MSIKESDIKLLWGRSGNRCAICRIPLSHEVERREGHAIMGRQAHIVAGRPNGPRGGSTLNSAERDAYANLILLCPNHHTLVDQDVEAFSVETLRGIKQNHEAWARFTLSEQEREAGLLSKRIYAWLIDSTTLKNASDPKWVAPLACAVTVILGTYFCLFAVLFSAKLAGYVVFDHAGENLLPRKLIAMLLLALMMLSARICGVATRESWWHLKGLWSKDKRPRSGNYRLTTASTGQHRYAAPAVRPRGVRGG